MDKYIGVGKNLSEKEREMKELNSELNVIREKLNHENVVRYYRTFVFERSLYIIMELVEGCSLTEVVRCTREKNLKVEEDRLWNVFVQVPNAVLKPYNTIQYNALQTRSIL